MTLRNAPCPCGSGSRLKHCCGALGDEGGDHMGITDADLLDALKRADDAHRAESFYCRPRAATRSFPRVYGSVRMCSSNSPSLE